MERHQSDENFCRTRQFQRAFSRCYLVEVGVECGLHYTHRAYLSELFGFCARLGLRPGNSDEEVLPGRLFYSAGFIPDCGRSHLALDFVFGDTERRIHWTFKLLFEQAWISEFDS